MDFIDKRPQYTSSFARSSKVIGVLWGVFSLCFTIIILVVFLQPQWIGDTEVSQGTGHFGLWQYCTSQEIGSNKLHCRGDLHKLDTIISGYFRISTILVGISFIATVLCICCFLLFVFLSAVIVFNICGSLQLISGLALTAAICVYPLGFDSPEVVRVCGQTTRSYNVGECEIRWAYLLAILGVLDTIGLSVLAFVLANRSKKLKKHILMQKQPMTEPLYSGSIYKGHVNPEFINDGMSISGSRKSLNLQPVMMMPRPEQEIYSDYEHARNKGPGFRAHY